MTGSSGALKSLVLAIACCLAAACGGGSGDEPVRGSGGLGEAEPRPRPIPGYAWVVLGTDTVVAEVAADPESRYEGLRFRESLPAGTGMLFVFETPGAQVFTMEDTYVPLDIAFIGPDLVIGEILAMDPLTTGYASEVIAQYALEVPQGWFAQRGHAVGTRVHIEF